MLLNSFKPRYRYRKRPQIPRPGDRMELFLYTIIESVGRFITSIPSNTIDLSHSFFLDSCHVLHSQILQDRETFIILEIYFLEKAAARQLYTQKAQPTFGIPTLQKTSCKYRRPKSARSGSGAFQKVQKTLTDVNMGILVNLLYQTIPCKYP